MATKTKTETKAETGKESITKTLARWIDSVTYADLPASVSEQAKLQILDSLACVYAGHDLPHSRCAKEIASHMPPGDCTVFTSDIKVGARDAALANGVMIHSTVEAGGVAGGGHPQPAQVATAIAVGEQERASGKETLLGVVVGYEMMSRFAMAVNPLANSAFRGPSIPECFGVAGGAGKLMKLDVDKLAHALSFAATMTPGAVGAGWWSGTYEPMFHHGSGSIMGITAAIIAKYGGIASTEELEGRHGVLLALAGTTARVSLLTGGLGKGFRIAASTMKSYPTCGVNAVPVELARRAFSKLGLKSKDIVKIVEKTWPGGTSYSASDFAGPYMNQFQAQMSMQFCASATILGRPVDSPQFFAEHYNDPEVNELAKKVELVIEFGRTGIGFEVHTTDGRVLTAEQEPRDREPGVPSRERIQNKFMTQAPYYLGNEKKAREVMDLVMNLDKVKDIREFTAKL